MNKLAQTKVLPQYYVQCIPLNRVDCRTFTETKIFGTAHGAHNASLAPKLAELPGLATLRQIGYF